MESIVRRSRNVLATIGLLSLMVALAGMLSAGPASAASLSLIPAPINEGRAVVAAFDAKSQAPIVGAEVGVWNANEIVAKLVTDDRGAAEVRLDEGTYKVQVYARGYNTAAASITVVAGEISSVKLAMVPAVQNGQINFRVHSGSSRVPVVGAWVQVYSIDGGLVAEGHTNKLGMFAQSLPAGMYAVTVKAIGYANYNNILSVQPEDSRIFPIALKASARH
jgi:hypothetical protein